MRHFRNLSVEDTERLFHVRPQEFTPETDKETLAFALGATLYIPSIRPTLAEDILKRARAGATSVVVCLEDSIPDDRVTEGEQNIVAALETLARDESVHDRLPLIFVRVRRAEQITTLTSQLGSLVNLLTGFVAPKFHNLYGHGIDSYIGQRYIDAVVAANSAWRGGSTQTLYLMPVLESPELIYRQTRDEVLSGVTSLVTEHEELVLAVRLGATDMSSAYALRRSSDLTIYDVKVVSDVIADAVNYLGRGGDRVISGPVWEHFSDRERIFKPDLRVSIFEGDQLLELRKSLVTRGMENLIREIELDRANGLQGKTVIHPTHVPVVHSLNVVTHEEFTDAETILSDENQNGGATRSAYRNKMNEVKPHRAWAERTMARARAFGVAREGLNFVDFLEASTREH